MLHLLLTLSLLAAPPAGAAPGPTPATAALEAAPAEAPVAEVAPAEAPAGEAAPAPTPAPTRGRLVVHITGMEHQKGKLALALHAPDGGFPKSYEKATVSRAVPIDGERVTVVFEGVPFGRYALAILHDEDGDLTMDTNFIGMPSEGVGMSNNPRPRFRMPRFDEAAFELKSAVHELTVEMVYI